MDAISEIKKSLGSEQLIIGGEECLKALRSGTLAKVFLSANPKPTMQEDIKRYAAIASVEIVQLEISNDELGTTCKKPFPISVLGLRK